MGSDVGRDINIGLSPEQVRDLVLTTVHEESTARAEVEALSQRLDVTEEAVTGFLRILNERAVPLEKLPETLAEIAQRHREMLAQLAILDPEDRESKDLVEKARTAIEGADFDRVIGCSRRRRPGSWRQWTRRKNLPEKRRKQPIGDA